MYVEVYMAAVFQLKTLTVDTSATTLTSPAAAAAAAAVATERQRPVRGGGLGEWLHLCLRRGEPKAPAQAGRYLAAPLAYSRTATTADRFAAAHGWLCAAQATSWRSARWHSRPTRSSWRPRRTTGASTSTMCTPRHDQNKPADWPLLTKFRPSRLSSAQQQGAREPDQLLCWAQLVGALGRVWQREPAGVWVQRPQGQDLGPDGTAVPAHL